MLMPDGTIGYTRDGSFQKDSAGISHLEVVFEVHQLLKGLAVEIVHDLAPNLAPRPGFEPGTCGLTVRRSTG